MSFPLTKSTQLQITTTRGKVCRLKWGKEICMTANQVAYWKNVETERSNRAQEDIRRREAGVKEGELTEKQLTGKVERQATTVNTLTSGAERGAKAISTLVSLPLSLAQTAMKVVGTAAKVLALA